MSGGVRRSFTAATKNEAESLALKWKLENKAPALGTLGSAMDRYTRQREAVLSPSTIRRYRKVIELNFLSLQRRTLSSISDAEFQDEINQMVKHYSSKTVKNTWAFVNAVLKENGRFVKVTLPQVVSAQHPFLEFDQIKPFLAEIKGEALEVPILLGLHGLRRSEIIDLEWTDVDLKKGTLSVSGAAVIGVDGLVHKKETKNASSRRTVPIMIPRLSEVLESSERNEKYVCTCNPNSIYNAVNRICDRLGYPKVGVHGLRHTFISLCYHEGISELACMKLGGYSDFNTMRKIYTHLARNDLDAAQMKLSQFYSE